MKRLAVASVLAAAVFGLVACTSSTDGGANPSSGGGQTTTGSGGGGTTTTSGGGGGSPLAALQPCNLVSGSEQTQLQVSQSQSGTESGARYCAWQRPVDASGQNGYVVSVDLRDSQGMDSVNTGGYDVTSETVGKHQGKQLKATASAGCIVVIGVSATSRVDVTATDGTATTSSCQIANQLANVVEPQLPSGS